MNKVNLKILKKNFEEKIQSLSKLEKDKYERVFKYISSFPDSSLNFQNPEEIYNLISSNPKWGSVNTWETNFAKLTALINFSEPEMGKKYVEYRNEKIKPETKSYSNNRNLKTFEPLEYKNDKDDYKRLILNLYIKYPPLRTDYSTVKLKDFNVYKDNYYRDGKIHFNHMIKNDNNITIALKDEERKIMETLTGEYLFTSIHNNKQTEKIQQTISNQYVKAIKNYSQELLGKSITINDFRRVYFTDFMKSVKGLEFPEAYIKVKEIAERSNTSIDQMINYYYGKN